MNSYTTHHTNISSRLNYIWCSKMWCLKCLYLNPSRDSFQHLSRLLKMRSILHMCPGIWNSLEFCVGCRGQNLYAKTVIFILHKDFYFQFCQHVFFFGGIFKNVPFWLHYMDGFRNFPFSSTVSFSSFTYCMAGIAVCLPGA